MGILDKLFAKKESAGGSMAIDSVGNAMAVKIQKDFDAIKEPLKDERKQMLAAADIMQGCVSALDRAKYPERTYPIIISKSNVSRKNFVTKMDLLMQQIRRPLDEKLEPTLEFYGELGKTIDAINSETIKDYAFLRMLFEKEGKDVVDVFRQIADIDQRIREMLKPIRDIRNQMTRASGIAGEIQKISVELGRDDLSKIAEAISQMQEELSRDEKELAGLLEGKEWKAVVNMREKAEKAKEMTGTKRREFEKVMEEMEAPLKKYKKVADSHLLDDYISKSFDSVLCDDPKGERILSLLKKIKTMITEGKIEIKDSEQAVKRIDELNDENTIGNLMLGYLKACEEAERLNEDALSSGVMKRKLFLDSESARLENKIEEENLEMKRTEEIAVTIRERRDQKAAQLEEILQGIFKKRVRIQL
jgi:hypothetical protein